MSNELLWFLFLLLNFVIVTAMYRFFGKIGIYVWVPVSIILANIQVLKTIPLFGITATLGGVMYAGTFLITDILGEIYGKKSARPAIWFGFIAQIATTLFFMLVIEFVPHESDWSQEHIEAIFGFFPAVTVASLLAFLVSQFHDIWAFEMWKKFRPAPEFLWLRNNMSTIVSQLIDSLLFISVMVLFGVFNVSQLLPLFFSTYITKLLIAVLDTPFVYLARYMKNKQHVHELV